MRRRPCQETGHATLEDCDEDARDSSRCDADCLFAECGDGYVNGVAGETCEQDEDCQGDLNLCIDPAPDDPAECTCIREQPSLRERKQS